MKRFINFNILAIGFMIIATLIGGKVAFAENNSIKSGIYEIKNDVYHENDTGMAMSRSYLKDTMTVEVRKDSICYTIGFIGSDYMENYRMKVNGEETPVEVITDSNEEGVVKIKVQVDRLDTDMDVQIYVDPMERDVEFKIIPNMDTLNLIEGIQEESQDNDEVTSKEEIEEEDITNSEIVEVSAKSSVVDNNKSNNITSIIVVTVAVVLIVGFTSIKLKRK